MQYANTNGSVIRSEDYWRWMIGRNYAHVIWVACQGETVRGYAFVKDHRILEIATDPAHPQALAGLAGSGSRRGSGTCLSTGDRPRARTTIPVIESFRSASGKIIDQDECEGSCSMYHVPDIDRFLTGYPARTRQPRHRRGCRASRWSWAHRSANAAGCSMSRRPFQIARRARQAQPPPPDA